MPLFGGGRPDVVRLKAKRDVPKLISALKYNDGRVRRAAAEALAEIGDGRAVEPLVAAFAHAHSMKQQAAGGAMLSLMAGDREAIGRLYNWPREIDDIEKALLTFGAAAVGPLIAAFQNGPYYVRQAAAGALGEIGDRRAVEPLIAELRLVPSTSAQGSFEAEVQDAAAVALGKIGDPRAVEPLIAALGNYWVSVQMAAASALGEIGDPRAVEPLTELADGESGELKKRATAALSKIRSATA